MISKQIRAAADLIEENGWWDGQPTEYQTYCVITACAKFGYHDAMSAIGDYLDLKVNDIPKWNDAQASGEVVIKTLRTIADFYDPELQDAR